MLRSAATSHNVMFWSPLAVTNWFSPGIQSMSNIAFRCACQSASNIHTVTTTSAVLLTLQLWVYWLQIGLLHWPYQATHLHHYPSLTLSLTLMDMSDKADARIATTATFTFNLASLPSVFWMQSRLGWIAPNVPPQKTFQDCYSNNLCIPSLNQHKFHDTTWWHLG